jgi:hypothetical protein
MQERTKTELARSYLTDSEAFLIAAQVLERSRSKRITFAFSPKYYLVCHAIELILKSFILVSGGKKRELMHPDLRHNLLSLFERATELGLAHNDPSFSVLIATIAPLHSEHRFRYRKTGFITVVETKQMSKIVEKLIGQIAPTVNAAMHAQIAAQRAARQL